MTTIYVASIETRNFSFEGYGATQIEAVQALRAAWNKHAQQYQARNVPLFDEPANEGTESTVPNFYGMTVHERTLGKGYRDGEALD
jgi:hypothetical protein